MRAQVGLHHFYHTCWYNWLVSLCRGFACDMDQLSVIFVTCTHLHMASLTRYFAGCLTVPAWCQVQSKQGLADIGQ